MSDNYSYLVMPFEEFDKTIKSMIEKGQELIKTTQKEDLLPDFKLTKENWVLETLDVLKKSFADSDNWFAFQFKSYAKPSQKSYNSYFDAFKSYKDEIRLKCYYLENCLSTISVCDYIRERDKTVKKENLKLIEKASILLEKLYHLDNEREHLARLLLVGNGVDLKRENEAIEIAKYLEERGFVNISHYASQKDVYLSITTDGKIVYEEETNHSPQVIDNNQDTYHTSITGIFIVHGHNNEMKETVARTVEKVGLNAIILHEQATQGKTVIEKFTTYSNEAQFAIVLLSADDYAYSKTTTTENAKLRPRQNVVFELGYFLGKLGRERVFCLYETLDEFEIHSDFAGVVLEHFDNRGAWKMQLGKELESLGVDIDWKQLMR